MGLKGPISLIITVRWYHKSALPKFQPTLIYPVIDYKPITLHSYIVLPIVEPLSTNAFNLWDSLSLSLLSQKKKKLKPSPIKLYFISEANPINLESLARLARVLSPRTHAYTHVHTLLTKYSSHNFHSCTIDHSPVALIYRRGQRTASRYTARCITSVAQIYNSSPTTSNTHSIALAVSRGRTPVTARTLKFRRWEVISPLRLPL